MVRTRQSAISFLQVVVTTLAFALPTLAQTTYELDGEWQAATVNQIPRNAVVGGTDIDGRKLVICRAPMGGGVHPGKIYNGMCNFGFAGEEQRVGTFEVLVGNSIERLWVSPSTGFASGSTAKPVGGATQAEGGNEHGHSLPICRAKVGPFIGAGPQPGKLIGDKCHIGFNHQEVLSGIVIEVLQSKVVLPSPVAQVWVDINRGGNTFDIVGDGDIPSSDGSSLAVYTDNWVVFFSNLDGHGSELRIKGPAYLADLRDFVKMNGPCVGGATIFPPGDWNDEITSVRVMPPDFSPDTCGTNCPRGSAPGYCGPALPPPPFVALQSRRTEQRRQQANQH